MFSRNVFTWILFGAAAHGDATFLLRGATIHTASSAAIEHGDLLVRNGKIARLGLELSAPKGTSEDMAFLPDAAMTLLGRSGPYRVH